MNVLHISSYVAPYLKTGEHAELAGALPRALAALGEHVALVLPRFALDPAAFGLARRLRTVTVPLGASRHEVTIFEGRLRSGRGEVHLWMLDHPLFERATPREGAARGDREEALAAGLLSRAGDLVANAFGFRAQVIHAHGWEAALALVYAQQEPARAGVRKVLTISDVTADGRFPLTVAEELGLGRDGVVPEDLVLGGKLSLLQAGIRAADRITTVSPRYAAEIQTPEVGAGHEKLLRARSDRLVGILGGIDYAVWNPAHDPALAAAYQVDELGGKRACKAALQRAMGLPDRPRTPLTASVLRDVGRRGIELVLQVLEGSLAERDAHVVVLGVGVPELEGRLLELARRFPTKLAVRPAYDETLAHRLYGGSDLLLLPPEDRPSARTALYGLRYGVVPVAHDSGGAADVLIDYDPRSKTGIGFKFTAATTEALETTWRRANTAYASDEGWPQLVRRGMNLDFSWAACGRGYVALYRSMSI